jgi:hypothetical protein
MESTEAQAMYVTIGDCAEPPKYSTLRCLHEPRSDIPHGLCLPITKAQPARFGDVADIPQTMEADFLQLSGDSGVSTLHYE